MQRPQLEVSHMPFMAHVLVRGWRAWCLFAKSHVCGSQLASSARGTRRSSCTRAITCGTHSRTCSQASVVALTHCTQFSIPAALHNLTHSSWFELESFCCFVPVVSSRHAQARSMHLTSQEACVAARMQTTLQLRASTAPRQPRVLDRQAVHTVGSTATR